MAVSSLLEIIALNEAQSNKATTVNTAVTALEAALADKLEVDTSAATSPGDIITIPFDDTNDLSPRDAVRCVFIDLLSGASEDFDAVHPDNQHLFLLRNSSSHTATVKTSAGTGVDVNSGGVGLLYCDGTDVINLTPSITAPGANITTPSDFEAAFFGMPDDGQIIGTFVVPRETTFPADLTGSQGQIGSNPQSTLVLDVDDDGTKIGEVNVNISGGFTFNTVGNTSKVVAAGSNLVIHNQTPADNWAEDIQVILVGTQIITQ